MTGIEWTDHVWNPVAGCSKVSTGCKNCYAIPLAYRLAAMGTPQYEGMTERKNGRTAWTGNVNLVHETLHRPLDWKKPCCVFVNSMSDLFHEKVPFYWVQQVADIMRRTPQHIYQVLTKRPERLVEYLHTFTDGREPFSPNVWVGVSVENAEAKHRIETLESAVIMGGVHHAFLSCEPLLGDLGRIKLNCIDWVIVGGESGHGARPMLPQWVRSIRDQCEADCVPFFFKQWGGVQRRKNGCSLDGRIYEANPCRDARNLNTKGGKMIISFAQTIRPLLAGKKTQTRRHWKPAQLALWQKQYDAGNKVHEAYNKNPRNGGRKIGYIALTCRPYTQRLVDAPPDTPSKVGFPQMGLHELIEQVYGGGFSHKDMAVLDFTFHGLGDAPPVYTDDPKDAA